MKRYCIILLLVHFFLSITLFAADQGKANLSEHHNSNLAVSIATVQAEAPSLLGVDEISSGVSEIETSQEDLAAAGYKFGNDFTDTPATISEPMEQDTKEVAIYQLDSIPHGAIEHSSWNYRPLQLLDRAADVMIRIIIPMQPVNAGGPFHVMKKIGRGLGKVLREVFRILNQGNLDRLGTNIGYNGLGQPYIKDVHFGTPQRERVVIYEKHGEKETTWGGEKYGTNLGTVVKGEGVFTVMETATSSEQPKRYYEDIDAVDTLFKAFNIVTEPRYEPREGSWLQMHYRDLQYYTLYYPWGKELPEHYYDYGYRDKLHDAYEQGFDLAAKFVPYDRYIQSYIRQDMWLDKQKSDLRKYEMNAWDELLSTAAKNLFSNGMWNDNACRDEFKRGFVDGSKQLAEHSGDYVEKRASSIVTSLQREFEFELESGYNLLHKNVEEYLQKHLDENALNQALRIVKDGDFSSEMREAAGQLLRLDSDEFGVISGKKSKLYRFEDGNKEYMFEVERESTLREFFSKLEKAAESFNQETRDFYEKISSMEPSSVISSVGPPIDFPTAKRKIVANALLGGSTSLAACKNLCGATMTMAGGALGMQQGAVAGLATGGPPGAALGGAVGGAMGATLGYVGSVASCDIACTALSRGAAASGGVPLENNFDSEYAYYSKSTSESSGSKSSQGSTDKSATQSNQSQDKKVIRHHILSDKHHTKYTKEFKRTTDKYDFKLSRNEDNIVAMEQHKGPHPVKYHDWCLRRLKKIDQEIEVAKSSLTQPQKNALFRQLFKERIAKYAPNKLIEYTQEADAARAAQAAAKAATKATPVVEL